MDEDVNVNIDAHGDDLNVFEPVSFENIQRRHDHDYNSTVNHMQMHMYNYKNGSTHTASDVQSRWGFAVSTLTI